MTSTSQKIVTGFAYALALLSVAAAIPKILQMPHELEFLAPIGFSGVAVSAHGLVQLAGGVLLAISKFRFAGAIIAGLAFLVSSIAIFASGNAVFGLISLIPVAVSVVVARNAKIRG